MNCKNCQFVVWYGDYALHYCDITKQIVDLETECVLPNPEPLFNCLKRLDNQKDDIDRLNKLVPPCKIGDEVYIIRTYHSLRKPQKGKVSEMIYLPDMTLQIVVKNIGRGRWGVDVFGKKEEAEKK